MINAISSLQFPYSYLSDTSGDPVDTPEQTTEPAIQAADSVRISAQAFAAAASYAHVAPSSPVPQHLAVPIPPVR